MMHFKLLGKNKKPSPKLVDRKKTIKLRAEINEMETKKIPKRINETKN
jgi:hypothetical protein